MKFKLSTLMSLVTIAGVSLGWLVDRRTCIDREKLKEQLEISSDLGFGMGSVSLSNRIYAQLESLPADEFADKRNFQLVQNVINMALNDLNASKPTGLTPEVPVPEWRRESMLNMCADALRLLDIETVDEFSKRFLDAGFVSEYTEIFASNEGVLDPAIADFIELALKRRLEWQDVYGE